MKKIIVIISLLLMGAVMSACSEGGGSGPSGESSNPPTESANLPSGSTETTGETMDEKVMTLRIDGEKVDVRWEDNQTVKELKDYLTGHTITVNSHRYGGFEQVGDLPQDFPGSDVQMTTKPGDIVLYSGNQLVVFFGSNSWRYTKLGHILDLSDNELTNLLNFETATIVISLE